MLPITTTACTECSEKKEVQARAIHAMLCWARSGQTVVCGGVLLNSPDSLCFKDKRKSGFVKSHTGNLEGDRPVRGVGGKLPQVVHHASEDVTIVALPISNTTDTTTISMPFGNCSKCASYIHRGILDFFARGGPVWRHVSMRAGKSWCELNQGLGDEWQTRRERENECGDWQLSFV